MTRVAVDVQGVSKMFRLYKDRNQSLKATVLRGRRASYTDFWALDDVTFEIPKGSTFGIIGENGSGKSTMLKCIANILQPDKGKITRDGRMAALLELGSGFHPELSGRDNVYLNGSILGLSRKEIDKAFDSIVDFSGIEQFIDNPVKNYSSGMYVRLGFSIAIHVEPEILLVDEILAVGDAAFQRKCVEKFTELRKSGRTVVMVSHSMGSLKDMCDHVVWLRHGKVVNQGKAIEVVDEYLSDTTEDRLISDTYNPSVKQVGSGEILITDVALLNDAGRQTTKYHVGEPFRLRMEYRCTKPVQDVVFGMSVKTLEGVKVWGNHTRDQGMQFSSLSGEGVIELVADRLLLNSGTYDLWVNITDESRSHQYHLLKDIIRFDVAPGSIRESDGLVVMGSHFENFVGD